MKETYEQYKKSSKKYILLFVIALAVGMPHYMFITPLASRDDYGVLAIALISFAVCFMGSIIYGVFSYIYTQKIIIPYAVLLAALWLGTAMSFAFYTIMFPRRSGLDMVFIYAFDEMLITILAPASAILTKGVRALIEHRKR